MTYHRHVFWQFTTTPEVQCWFIIYWYVNCIIIWKLSAHYRGQNIIFFVNSLLIEVIHQFLAILIQITSTHIILIYTLVIMKIGNVTTKSLLQFLHSHITTIIIIKQYHWQQQHHSLILIMTNNNYPHTLQMLKTQYEYNQMTKHFLYNCYTQKLFNSYYMSFLFHNTGT